MLTNEVTNVFSIIKRAPHHELNQSLHVLLEQDFSFTPALPSPIIAAILLMWVSHLLMGHCVSLHFFS